MRALSFQITVNVFYLSPFYFRDIDDIGPFANIKHRESLPGTGVTELKRHEKRRFTVFNITQTVQL